MRPGFGFGPGRSARRRPGGSNATPTGPTATFTMTQLAAANRIYQRLSDTDGGEGKGQGIVPVTIEATQSGTVQARCRSAADGTTILQAAWDAATIAASGAQTLAIGGVDARLGWFYLDLLDSSGSWQLGTTPIGMGSLTAVGGQSLMSRFLGRVNGEDTTTLAMLGIVPSPYGRAFVKYTDGGTHDATAWERPADAAQSAAPTSAGVAELLNLQIAALGVNCGVIGYARGATAIATWQAGQTDGTELAAVMANAGGAFERFFWFQGHGDAAASTSSYASYYAALASFFASIASLNARSFAIYLTAIPNINSASWGSSPKRSEIRKAQEDWAADNGATCLGFADLELYSDGIHEIQAGARRVARHLCRAMLAENGPGNDEGPRVIRATKAGTDITLDVAHARGTTLTGIGNPGTRFLVTRAWDPALGALALDGTVPIALSAEAITLRLASDPGDIPLDVWPMRADPTNNGAADAIYDDDDPEGFGVGRQLQAATVPVRTRRNTPLNTAVAGYVTSYGPGRFGQGRASGEMRGPYNGLIGKPYTGLTIDFWLTPANVSISGTKVLVSSSFSTWIGVNAASLIYQVGDSASTTISGLTLAAGQSYHFRLCIDPGGRSWRFHVNGVLRSSGTGAANIGYSIGSPFIIGGHETTPGAYHYAQGVIDEVAIFGHPLGAGDFTPPTSPWSGAEPGLLHLWHCDGNGLDSAGLDGSA